MFRYMKTRPNPVFALTLFLGLFWAFSAQALSLIGEEKEEPLLDPTEAFITQVKLDDQNHLNVEINIAPGYFVYRSKINVKSDGAEFGPLQIPDGEKKNDQFFGEVETYRGLLQYKTPLVGADANGPVVIQVQSQGCADVGVCYPPYTEEFTINVSDVSALAAADTGGGLQNLPLLQNTGTAAQQDSINTPPLNTSGLGLSTPAPLNNSASSAATPSSEPTLADRLRMDTEDEVLDPEVAFTFEAGNIENGAVPIKWNITEGHYLYKKRFSFALLEPETATLGEAKLDKGIWEEDAFFGKSEVYRTSTSAQLPITLPEGVTQATVKIGYQGCADIGICYPPIFKEVQIAAAGSGVLASVSSTPAQSSTGTGAQQQAVAPTNEQALNSTAMVGQPESNASALVQTNAAPVQNEQDRLANSLASGSRWLTIATFFGLGLLLTFTPCVLPMIPILSSIIVGKGDEISTGRAFTLSLVYVLAMALTYTVAGVLVGLSGENIQATLQHPYVLSALALLFVVLSMSMFGFYELQMPQFVQNRLSSVSNKQKSGSFGGVATMGFLSALIVGPCVTAPLVGALIYIGQTGDAVLGGAALFALAMGMGIPLLIIGTAFGKYLPRAGAWMDTTKAIFGVMLLGLAIYMLDRVIPTWATMLLSALLLISVGMFMGALESLPADARGWRRVNKGFGYAAIVYGTLLIIGVATGTGTLFRPMQGLSLAGHSGDAGQSSEHVSFQTVKTVDQLNTVLAQAKQQNQPVIFDFYADWCISCKEMEAFTFTDSKVAAKMKQAVLLQADVTANDDSDKSLLKEFGIFGPPAIIMYDREGNEQRNARVVGFMSADKFSTVLDRVY